MKYFYDTEFVDTGTTVDMISIGIVAEDGRNYYAISNEFDMEVASANVWINTNVLAKLPPNDSPEWKSRETIAREVHQFLSEDGMPDLWAWFASYDHLVLSQLYGRMLDLPDPIPMFTNDLRSIVKLLGVTRLPALPESDCHDALTDALLLSMRYKYVQENYGHSKLNL